MKTSENITDLAAALAKAQSEMKNAHYNKVNPGYKSRYADLASVRDAVIPALSKHGLSVIHLTSIGEGCIIVHTRLMHATGQWIESDFPIISDFNKPQAIGSAYSYARRYSLSAICNIASEEDDDGNEAQDHGARLPEMPSVNGRPGASKAASRNDYEACIKEIRNMASAASLTSWYSTNAGRVDQLPADWIDELRVEYTDKLRELKAALAA